MYNAPLSLLGGGFAFFAGLIIAMLIGAALPRVGPRLAVGYYLYHAVFSVAFYVFSQLFNIDSKRYYLESAAAHDWLGLYGVDINFIEFVSYPFIHGLGFTYFAMFMLFGIFGYIGNILAFATVCERTVGLPNYRTARLFALAVMLLPAQNFWTAVLGKDGLMFMGLSLVAFAISKIGTARLPLLLFGLVIVFQIRPHIGGVVMAGMLGATIISGRLSLTTRVGLGLLGGIALAAAVPFILSYAKVPDAGGGVSEIDSVTDYLDARRGLQGTGGGTGSQIDLNELGVVGGAFAYLFRPLFVDASSKIAFIASFENAFYLVVFMRFVFDRGFYAFLFRRRGLYQSFLIVHFVLALALLSYVTTNLGLAMRQKTMLMFAAMALFTMYLAERRTRRVRRLNPTTFTADRRRGVAATAPVRQALSPPPSSAPPTAR